MSNFQNKWSKPVSPGITERINEAVKPKGALKPRVEVAVKRLQGQISKLDNMLTKLKQRDEKIFNRIVIATQQHDTHSSKVLSNELAEVRKVSRVLGNARMALEQIELRLTTFHDLGDTVVTIMPTIGLMRSLKSSTSAESDKILQEAAAVAETAVGEKFPSMPVEQASPSSTTTRYM